MLSVGKAISRTVRSLVATPVVTRIVLNEIRSSFDVEVAKSRGIVHGRVLLIVPEDAEIGPFPERVLVNKSECIKPGHAVLLKPAIWRIGFLSNVETLKFRGVKEDHALIFTNEFEQLDESDSDDED